jgi:hypothetical protein
LVDFSAEAIETRRQKERVKFGEKQEGERTTGNRAPQMRMSEKERMSPILAEMFSCGRSEFALFFLILVKGCGSNVTYMCARVKTLCA